MAIDARPVSKSTLIVFPVGPTLSTTPDLGPILGLRDRPRRLSLTRTPTPNSRSSLGISFRSVTMFHPTDVTVRDTFLQLSVRLGRSHGPLDPWSRTASGRASLITFSVHLGRKTDPIAIEKVRSDLEMLFTEHVFIAGGSNFPDVENNILALDDRSLGVDGVAISRPPNSIESRR